MRTPRNFKEDRQAFIPLSEMVETGLDWQVPHCSMMRQAGIAADESWLSQTSAERVLELEVEEPIQQETYQSFAAFLKEIREAAQDGAFDEHTESEALTERLADIDEAAVHLARIFDPERLAAERQGWLARARGNADDHSVLLHGYSHMIKQGGCEGPRQWPPIPVLGKIGCTKLVCPFGNDPEVDAVKDILDGNRTMPAAILKPDDTGWGINCRSL